MFSTHIRNDERIGMFALDQEKIPFPLTDKSGVSWNPVVDRTSNFTSPNRTSVVPASRKVAMVRKRALEVRFAAIPLRVTLRSRKQC